MLMMAVKSKLFQQASSMIIQQQSPLQYISTALVNVLLAWRHQSKNTEPLTHVRKSYINATNKISYQLILQLI